MKKQEIKCTPRHIKATDGNITVCYNCAYEDGYTAGLKKAVEVCDEEIIEWSRAKAITLRELSKKRKT